MTLDIWNFEKQLHNQENISYKVVLRQNNDYATDIIYGAFGWIK